MNAPDDAPDFAEVGAPRGSSAADRLVAPEQFAGALILVADSCIRSQDEVMAFLKQSGYVAWGASNFEAALNLSRWRVPDLILLDMDGGDTDWNGLLKAWRAEPDIERVPIILMSGSGKAEEIATGFDLGVSDHVYKPINFTILAARIRAHLTLAHSLQRLKAQNRRLAQEADRDPLTGLHNRRALMKILESAVERSHRYGFPLTLLMLDLDHFKRVNDRLGHVAGDDVLRRFGERALNSLREGDVLARYGGEEFCAILFGIGMDAGIQVAERVRAHVEETPFSLKDACVPITVSIGVASVGGGKGDLSGAELIKRADRALYAAKRRGRNCVVTIDALLAEDSHNSKAVG